MSDQADPNDLAALRAEVARLTSDRDHYRSQWRGARRRIIDVKREAARLRKALDILGDHDEVRWALEEARRG